MEILRHSTKCIVVSLISIGLTFIGLPVRAQSISSASIKGNTLASEYYVGVEYGKPLISVNIVSGVSKPGVYHVPIGTDLAQLMAYAGGSTDRADLEEITVRRSLGQNQEIFVYDLERMLRRPSQMPLLTEGDVVHIPLKSSADKTLTWVNLIAGVVSIGLSIVLINDIGRRQ